MRILIVCPYDIGRPGGVQRHILDTGAALAERGHAVTVLAPRSALHVPAVPGVTIARLGRAHVIALGGTRYEISLALGADRRRLRALMRSGFDVAIFHTVWVPFLAPQALRGFDGPAVAMFHDTVADSRVGRVMRWTFRRISKWLLPRFGAILTPSRSPQDNLVPAPGQRVEIFPPTTDLRPFRAVQPGSGAEPLTILFLGRLEPRKGAHILLEAFRLLSGSRPGIRLVLAGAGPQEAALRAQAAGLPGVIFAGAPVDAAPLFAEADIFCAPSPYGESFGIVIAEAMSAGKPVVAAANAGYRSVLTGEATRFLVPPGDAGALAAALIDLLADAPLRARLGAWGREAALAYDCRALAPRLEGILGDAIAAHRPR